MFLFSLFGEKLTCPDDPKRLNCTVTEELSQRTFLLPPFWPLQPPPLAALAVVPALVAAVAFPLPFIRLRWDATPPTPPVAFTELLAPEEPPPAALPPPLLLVPLPHTLRPLKSQKNVVVGLSEKAEERKLSFFSLMQLRMALSRRQ